MWGNIGWAYVKVWEWIHSVEPNTNSESCENESGSDSDILHETETRIFPHHVWFVSGASAIFWRTSPPMYRLLTKLLKKNVDYNKRRIWRYPFINSYVSLDVFLTVHHELTIYSLPTWCTDYYLFIKYSSPLHVSSLKCSSSGGYSCIHAAYGTVTL